jgi:hypothetical protein
MLLLGPVEAGIFVADLKLLLLLARSLLLLLLLLVMLLVPVVAMGSVARSSASI